MPTLAKRIAELRARHGLSQEEFGAKVNLSRNSIIDYESGRSLPRRNKLIQLADAFGVSVEWLSGESVTTPVPSPTAPPPAARPAAVVATLGDGGPNWYEAQLIVTREYLNDVKAERNWLKEQYELLKNEVVALREELGKFPGDLDQPGTQLPIPFPPATPPGYRLRCQRRTAGGQPVTR